MTTAVQPADGLTSREREVLDLLARGASNREIADRLGISESTVSKHVSRILEALGVTNRTQAALSVRARSD
jgi:RNA polymerase sigma factor (sigma-70 family)